MNETRERESAAVGATSRRLVNERDDEKPRNVPGYLSSPH